MINWTDAIPIPTKRVGEAPLKQFLCRDIRDQELSVTDTYYFLHYVVFVC